MLIGLPGAGKTTTGRRLAAGLGVAFADSDRMVEHRAGRTVAEIFAADGEGAFRALEAQVIADALRDFGGVLALGGGAVLSESTRAALAGSGSPVVLLRASVRSLSRRVGTGKGRPLLAGGPAAKLAVLASDRGPLYRELATHVVTTDRRSSSRVATEIAALLAKVNPQ